MTNNRITRCRQQGVTLVELLVALMLGLLLTAGMIQVFIGNRTTYEFNDSLSRIQENARFTLDHIAYNTRMASYKGCIADIAIHNNLASTNPFRDDIENGIRGYDANGTGDNDGPYNPANDSTPGWSPGLPPELNNEVLAGSDVLVVRSIGNSAVQLVSPFTNAAQLFVDPAHNFLIGEILVVSDCQKASIFQVTNINNDKENIVHSEANFSPGNTDANWDSEQDYGLGAELARLQAFAYYVGLDEDTNRPALFQLRLRVNASGNASTFVPEELASDIETFQVRYGVDTDNDEAIDDLVSADVVGNWSLVRSVEVSVLARASDEYGTETDTVVYRVGGTRFNPPDDRRLRQVFSTSIGVRNRLP